MRIVAFMTLLLLPIVSAGTARAEKPVTPESLVGATVVTTEWMKANHDGARIFDVRKKAEYMEGHLPNAVSAPYREKSEKKPDFDPSKDRLDLTAFPPAKDASIVVYCNGKRCWKSFKAATTLVAAGYTNVKWYRDGYPGWKAKGYPVE